MSNTRITARYAAVDPLDGRGIRNRRHALDHGFRPDHRQAIDHLAFLISGPGYMIVGARFG